MTHGSLFSGIGGFDLAAEWMGWQNIFHCEIGEFPRKILKHHFPNSICYEDIKKTDFTKHRGQIDIISGGFPCQPYSNAGKRRGKEDDRHLWPEMLRVIREIQPRFVVGENVAGLLSWNNRMVFHEIITDLENEGYETQAFLIPACATNAPHRRDRIWFVAHSIYCGYSTKRGKETEKDGIQSKIGKTMDSREFNGTSVSRNVAHSSSNGGSQNTKSKPRANKENREQFERLYNTEDVAHSNNSRTNERMQFDGERKENDEQWRGQSQSEYRENGINGITAHTDNGSGLRDTVQSRRTELEELHDSPSNVADSNAARIHEQYISKKSNEKKPFNRSFNERGNFTQFPTQSPICGGDDGIPTELDGITFPKWRNESIKGYGNAVVPQVVYQIFKAIEQSLL